MMSHNEALKLLEKYGISERVLRHSMAVNNFALKLARKFNKEGVNVNIEMIDIGSLLHDIGRKLAKKNKIRHAIAGKDIATKENLSEIKNIIGNHGLFSVFDKNALKTWEEKIVFYSDKRVEEDRVSSLDERLYGLIQRHQKDEDEIRKAWPFVKNIEKEILGVINGNK